MKLTFDHVSHFAGRLKHHAMRGYKTVRHFAGQLDRAVNIADTIFQATRPALSHYAPTQEQKIAGAVDRSRSRYEDIRKEANTGHNLALGVVKNIKKKIHELNC